MRTFARDGGSSQVSAPAPCFLVEAARRFHGDKDALREVNSLDAEAAPAVRRDLAAWRARDSRTQLVHAILEWSAAGWPGDSASVRLDGRDYAVGYPAEGFADADGWRLTVTGRGGLPHPDGDDERDDDDLG